MSLQKHPDHALATVAHSQINGAWKRAEPHFADPSPGETRTHPGIRPATVGKPTDAELSPAAIVKRELALEHQADRAGGSSVT